MPFDAINGALKRLKDIELLNKHPFKFFTNNFSTTNTTELERGIGLAEKRKNNIY